MLFRKFYDIECNLRSSSLPIAEAIKSNSAYLLIGDEALGEALKWPKLFIYDIGEMWYKNTGLPSVFALWIIRKACCKEKAAILERFKKDLLKAKISALRNFESIAKASPLRDVLSEEELVSYWKGISYDFTDEHRKGLELFRDYSKELGLI